MGHILNVLVTAEFASVDELYGFKALKATTFAPNTPGEQDAATLACIPQNFP